MEARTEALALLSCHKSRVVNCSATFRDDIFSIFKGHAVQENRPTPRNIGKEQKVQIYRGGSLKSLFIVRGELHSYNNIYTNFVIFFLFGD